MDPVSKILEEKTGVQLEIIEPAGDTNEKLNLMLNTGDIPDFLHIQMPGSTLIPKMIDAKIALSIDDLAKQYNCQNILNQINEDEKVTYQFHRYADGDFYNPDGKIYYLCNYQLSKKYYDIVAADEIGNPAYMVRNAVWEKMGRPSIGTPDELYNVLKRVKDEGYKDIKGQPMIPMSFETNAREWDQTIFAGSFGLIYPYYVEKNSLTDPKVTHFVKNPRFLEFVKYSNKLWRAGLIEPESFTIKSEQHDEKLMNGTYFMEPPGVVHVP